MTNKIQNHLKAGMRLLLVAPLLAATTTAAWADIENTAQVTGSTPRGANVTASSTETITLESVAPAFTIAHSISSISAGAGSDAANPDGADTITYEYLVANTGNVSLDSTTLDITVPNPGFGAGSAANTVSALAYVSGDTGADDVFSVGETWLYRATYTLAQADVDLAAGITDGVTSTITTAEIDGTGTFGAATFDTGTSSLTANGTIPINGSLQLVKLATRNGTTEDDGFSDPYDTNDVVTYRMTVTNNGNVTMSTMTVSETAFDGTGGIGSISAISCATSLDATIATLAPGSSEVCTATYTIVEADL